MARYLRVIQPYVVLLLIVTAGRWILGFKHVPYEVGTDKLSIVTLTLFASIFYGAFCRRWRGFTLPEALAMGATIAFFGQLAIVLSTLASYALGMDTYFNDPHALNVPAAISLGEAMGRRFQGMLTHMVVNGIVGIFGWALGGLFPSDSR